MLVLVGLTVVTVSVFVGFIIAGGPMMVLVQPAEFLIIGGAGLGALLIGTPLNVVKQLVSGLIATTKATPFNRVLYLDVLQMLYEVLVKAKKSGLIALEKDLATPAESPLFGAHPAFLHHHEAVQFTCEALAMLVDGSISPDDFDQVLDSHIETHHDEAVKPAGTLAKIGDAMPGLGIVAAVLGIVITMQHVDGKPEEIGHHVAAALVGTFLGILLSYGYIQPLSAKLEDQAAAEGRFLNCIKKCLVAFARGAPPLVAVEIGRHVVFTDERPSAADLEEACRNAGRAG